MTSATAPDTCPAAGQPPMTPEETSTPPLHDTTQELILAPPPVTDSAAIETPPLTTVTTKHDEEDEESEEATDSLERDHPSFSDATISLIMQLLPEDGHPEGRLVLIAVKSHNLPPLISTQRMGTFSPLSPSVTTLLQQWETSLPEALSQRTLTRAKEREVQRLKEAERKAQRTVAKRPDHKKPEKPKPTPTRTATAGTSTADTASPTNPDRLESQSHLF